MKKAKKLLSFFLAITMLLSCIAVGMGGIVALAANVTVTNVDEAIIAVPETVYMTPSTGASTTGQYYVNNTVTSGSYELGLEVSGANTNGYVQFYIPGATDVQIAVNTVTSGIGDIVFTEAGSTSSTSENISLGSRIDANGYFAYNTVGLYISGTGITAGNTALAEWVFTVTMNDGSTRIYYAYTTLYAPFYAPVGAAAHSVTSMTWGNSNRQAWAGSILWVSGVHGYTAFTGHTNSDYYLGAYYPNYNSSNKNFLPMMNVITSANNNGPSNWISNSSSSTTIPYNSISYTRQEADGNNNHLTIFSASPIATMTVDTSRYSNFNQIPNFTVGFFVTDLEKDDSSEWYIADYTGYTTDIQCDRSSTDSRSDHETYYDRAKGENIASGSGVSCGVKYNGQWNKTVSSSGTYTIKAALVGDETGGAIKRSAWNMNFVQMNVTGVSKNALRSLVIQGTSLNEKNYTADTWSSYKAQLRAAAQVLGNPVNSSVDTSALISARDALTTTLYFDGNGGTPTYSSLPLTMGTSTTWSYSGDISAYNATRTGYTFLGWSTDKNATAPEFSVNGNYVKVGFNTTLYAVWQANTYNVVFDNLIAFSNWNTTSANNATISNVTDNGFTLTSNEGAGEGTSSSPFFPVTPGKQYKIDIDFEGDGWDVYIFFCNESGGWVDFKDGPTNRYSSNGSTGVDKDNAVFTAPSDTSVVKAQIRVDANGSNNAVTFSNIRVYEVGTVADGVSYHKSQTATYDSTFGTLPTPTRAGFDFIGWYNGEIQYEESTKVAITSTLYLTSKWRMNDSALVEDNIILDFDKPVTFNPFDNDTIFNSVTKSYTLDGISTDGTNYEATINGAYGTLSVNGDNITYTPTDVLNGIDAVYYHVSVTVDGIDADIVGAINIAPASNVLYEEDNFEVTNEEGAAWTTDGTAGTASQTTDSNIYGYDTVYNGNIGDYSNGSALKVTVDSTNKRAEIQSFTFNGTGFDLYGQCGPDTGVMIVTVKNGDEVIKASIVDTYYNDSAYKTLNQVPIVSYSGASGTYTVQVSSIYLASAGAVKATQAQSVMGFGDMMAYSAPASGAQMLYEALAEVGMEDVFEADDLEVIWFDDDSVFNGGYGADTYADAQTDSTSTASTAASLTCVIDSIRVYNPIETDWPYVDSEQGAQYSNVISNLVSGNLTNGSGKFAYIEGETYETVDFATYAEKGPKNEFYLAPATEANPAALVFTVGNITDGSKIMISLRAASGTPKVKINDAAYDVTSSTEMYYDITDYVDADGTVTIQNVGDGLLAIDNLKVTGAVAVMSTFSLMTARRMMAAPAEDVVPNTPEETPEVEDTTTDTSTDSDTSTQESTEEIALSEFINKIVSFIRKIINSITSLFGI